MFTVKETGQLQVAGGSDYNYQGAWLGKHIALSAGDSKIERNVDRLRQEGVVESCNYWRLDWSHQ